MKTKKMNITICKIANVFGLLYSQVKCSPQFYKENFKQKTYGDT